MALHANITGIEPVDIVGAETSWDTHQDYEILRFLIITASLVLFSRGKLLPRSSQCLEEALITIIIVIVLNLNALVQNVNVRELANVCLYTLVTVSAQIGIATALKRQPDFKHKLEADPKKHSPLQPMIFPCRTSHTRLFPVKHSFSYSYLLVGIPVNTEGAANTLLSFGKANASQAWFSVHPEDYLARGTHQQGLSGKLQDYLVSQGIEADQYPYVYLVTAPRFLGFSFNPVSFWYLYDKERVLKAMILEVNNTFDERRMYFMTRTSDIKDYTTKFSSSWTKDFHVSPFNDRDGSYSLTADCLLGDDSAMKVNNTIVLQSENNQPKIVARIFSTEPALDPAKTNKAEAFYFLARWWWVGFMTNPRILREARKLWVKKLQVFYRPEVVLTSIGRNETAEELAIEPFFRTFLQALVDRSGTDPISYHSAAGPDRGRAVKITPCGKHASSTSDGIIEIRVLTPAFYAEMVRVHSVEEAFRRLCLKAADGEAMLHIKNSQALQDLLKQVRPDQCSPASLLTAREFAVVCIRQQGILAMLRLRLQRLYVAECPLMHLSDFDQYVKDYCKPSEYRTYLGLVLYILIADRVAVGFVSLLKVYILLGRLTAVLVATTVASPLQQVAIAVIIIIRWLASALIPFRH